MHKSHKFIVATLATLVALPSVATENFAENSSAVIRFIDSIDLSESYANLKKKMLTNKCSAVSSSKMFDGRHLIGQGKDSAAQTFSSATNSNACQGLVNTFVLTKDKKRVAGMTIELPPKIQPDEFRDMLERHYGKPISSSRHDIFLHGNRYILFSVGHLKSVIEIRPVGNPTLALNSTPEEKIKFFVGAFEPGKSNKDAVNRAAALLGCKLERRTGFMDEKTKQPEYDLASNWHSISDCLGMGAIVKFRNDNKDVLEEIEFPVQGTQALNSYRIALEKLYGKPIVNNLASFSDLYLYDAGTSVVHYDSNNTFGPYRLHIGDRTPYAIQFEERLKKQQAEKEEAKRREEAQKQLEIERERVKREAPAYKGMIFGVATPGETSRMMLNAKLDALGCTLGQHNVAFKRDGRNLCFALPGETRVSFIFRNDVVQEVNLFTMDKPTIADLRNRFNRELGKAKPYDQLVLENQDLPETKVAKKHGKYQYWLNGGKAVVEQTMIDIPTDNAGIVTIGIFQFQTPEKLKQTLNQIENVKAERRKTDEEAKHGFDKLF